MKFFQKKIYYKSAKSLPFFLPNFFFKLYFPVYFSHIFPSFIKQIALYLLYFIILPF